MTSDYDWLWYSLGIVLLGAVVIAWVVLPRMIEYWQLPTYYGVF